jgi:hypothetical protein
VHSHGCYGHGVPRMPTDKPKGKPISVPLVATTFYKDNDASYRSYVQWQLLLKGHPYKHANNILTRVPLDTPPTSPHPGDSGVAAVRLGV